MLKRFFIYLVCFLLFSFSKEKNNLDSVSCKIYIENSTTKKKVNLCNQLNLKKIIAVFGLPLKVERENNSESDDSGEEPWTEIYYSGLKISLIGNRIEELEVSNKNWKINNLIIGSPTSSVIEKYKKVNRKYKDYLLFSIENFDGVLYIKKSIKNRIILLGISSS